MTKVRMVCTKCGSTEVRRNAEAVWNYDTQDWEMVVVFDYTTCENCGECSIDKKTDADL